MPKGLGRNEVAIGDTVGFLDRQQQQRSGCVTWLNDKTVTLLHRVAGTGVRRIWRLNAA